MGGIGKTTLARNAYGDQLIVEHFQVRVWITISQDYSLRRILLDLLGSLKEFNTDGRKESIATRSEKGNEALANKSDHEIESVAKRSQQLDEFVKRSKQGNKPQQKIPEASNSDMALEVYKILAVRRFLIVMDDIWSTKVLDDVRHLFPNSNNGSRIVLTTRLIEVATYAKSSTLSHEMHLLDADRSWNLLCQKVFIHQDHVPQELDSIGREIARSCGGLPLAIVVIAGLLSTTNKSLNAWEEVAKNIKSALATADGQIEKILSISYNHLPHRLRSCFLYIGGFPEDHEIKVTDLIKLWIAESFVKPVVSKQLEDTAQEYLEDLVDRSLIIVTKRYYNGKIKSCSLHDTLREMCIKLCQEESFLLHVKDSEELKGSMSDQRRISISMRYFNYFPTIHNSTIRTIMYFQGYLSPLTNFSLLKVLNVLTTQYDERSFPSDLFFKLIHLRYLALCQSYLIPRGISNLQSLQTLIIKEIKGQCFPYEIWNMLQLRHLILSKIRLADTTPATSALENLQTLGKVDNLTCSVSTLNLIPNLTKLSLIYSFGSGELLLHNLVHLHRLEKLHLELGYGWRNFGKPNLVVPSALKKLTLMGWGCKEPYLDIVGPFPNLEELKLKSFDFMLREWRTAEEDFPELKFLLIEESDLRKWDTETSHFPKLKSILLHSCIGLNEIPECIGELPTLELIELKDCTDSLADSANAIQEEAQNYGDAFQLRCIACKPSRDLRQPSLYEKAM